MAALAIRVARLERRHWNRRRLAIAALVLLAVGFGAFTGRLVDPGVPFADERLHTVAPPSEPLPRVVVEASEFVLRATTGQVRGRLSLLPDGAPYLQLMGPDGQSEAQLSAGADSDVQLRLSSAESQAVVTSGGNGLPSLGLWRGQTSLFQAPANVSRFPPPRAWQ